MKIYLGLITAAALALAACGESTPAKPAETTPPAASAEASTPAMPAEPSTPVAASEAEPAVSTPATAEAVPATGECSAVITSDDAMKYDPKEITIKSSCKQFSITLKHVGKMPAMAMGHNVVIAKTADKDAVLADGANAKAENNFVKVGDERVVAHTKLIGGGEEDTVTFDVAKLAKGEAYEYFCSFPGHYAMMNGKIVLTD